MGDVKTPPAVPKSAWKKGQSGNPKGRPKDVRTIRELKNDLEIAVREQLTATRVTQVVNRMLDLAVGGDVKAAKLILDMAISKSELHQDQAKAPSFHIVIENATIAAQKPAIDITPTVIEVSDG